MVISVLNCFAYTFNSGSRWFLLISVSASPATVDFLVLLDRDFQTIVVDHLGSGSRDAIKHQKPVSTMTPATRKRIRKEILELVYGMLTYYYYC
jgi:hypothetical protein